ncbi:glycosyltransferase family protein [Anaerostipes faecalis]|uniref:hypothetical protein n=1 Tax=Anaerostipes faecalis TaxID=2738446 RepID=UPI001C1E6FA7|nr:hypothetical protein [Anaerostipes faecalis]
MKILIINGDYIQTNTSANLCHLSYIKGLVDSGYKVTLLSADGRDYVSDTSMIIPDEVERYTYYGVSFYEKMSLKKKQRNNRLEESMQSVIISDDDKPSLKGRTIKFIKKLVLSLYGVHGTYVKFMKEAQSFQSNEEFDYILSISTPATSHLLAHNLIKSGHISGKHWIQIWEDPWYSDAYGYNSDKRIYREEKRLISFAEKVCYVSPLTLKNQKKLYPEFANKMYWQPLPYYYKEEQRTQKNLQRNSYGYFGAYYPAARNLEPFYQAAIRTGVRVNICGDPSNLFVPTEHVHIYPRLPLDELKPIEDSTNVLIFLCNRKGGQIPGKIYQYSATNKIILFIMDGTSEEQEVLKNYFGKFNRYMFCENTVEDIIRAIKQIEDGNFGNIENKPVDDFNPKVTIHKILEGVKE